MARIVSIDCIGAEQLAAVKRVMAGRGAVLQDVRQVPTHTTQVVYIIDPAIDVYALEADLDMLAGCPRGRVTDG